MSTLAASRRSATELLVTTLTDGVQKLLATRRQGRGPPRNPSPLTTESSTLRKLATFAADQQDAKLLYHQSGAAKLESWMRMAASRRRSAAGGHKLAGGEGSSRPCWKGDCRAVGWAAVSLTHALSSSHSLTAIERWHHTHIRGRVARVLLGSHTFAPYSHAEISSEVV